MKPFPYQVDGIKYLASKKRGMIRDDPGLGKTCQLILASIEIGAKAVLILCPKSMVITWEREIIKWGGDLKHYTIINYHKLLTSKFTGLNKCWDLVIVDESHNILKNLETKQAKALFVIFALSQRIWLATATVASISGLDYYGTLRVLLPDLMKGWSATQFKKRYCLPMEEEFFSSKPRQGCKCIKLKENSYKCIATGYTGFNNQDELEKILSKVSIRRLESEVGLQLPELTETEMVIPGGNTFITDFEDLLDEVSQPHYHEELIQSGLNKIESLIELLNTYPKEKKVVIFAWHREVIEKTMEAIGKEFPDRKVASITGETSAKVRQQAIDDFQTGNLNYLVVNMQSGGAGITLTAATCGIYIQFPHSVIHWVQSRKRIHRIGSKKPVQIIKMISKNSIDEDVFALLSSRAANIKEIEG